VNTAYLGRILDGRYPTIRVAIAEAMTARYRQLRWKPGTSHFAVHSAARRGWHGPFAWDGNIDDPDAQPETLPTYAPLAANGRDSMRKAEIEHLYLLGESIPSIAKQLGANEKYTSDQLAAVLRERAAKTLASRSDSERAAA
jgi:hypothetical protein